MLVLVPFLYRNLTPVGRTVYTPGVELAVLAACVMVMVQLKGEEELEEL